MYVKPLVFTWPCAMLLRGSIGALWRRTWHGAGIKLRRDTLGVSLCGFTAHTRGQSDYIEAAKGRTCGSPFAQYNEARATGPTQGAAGGRSVTYGWICEKTVTTSSLRRGLVLLCFINGTTEFADINLSAPGVYARHFLLI